MKKAILLLATVLYAGAIFGAITLPDMQPIYDEMDALVDGTPQVSKKNAKASDKYVDKGIKAHDKKNYKKAVSLYQKALKKNPLNSRAYYELSMTQYHMGQLQEAYKSAARANALAPGFEGPYIIIASIEDDGGYPDLSIKTLDRLISVDPKSFMAWLNKGITLLKQKDYPAAEECMKKAAELDDKHPSPYYFLFVSSAMQGYNYDEERYIKQFLEVGQNDHRRTIVENRLKELQDKTVYLPEDSEEPSLDLMEQLVRLNWRLEKHRESYPTARGYRPSLKEERAVAETLLAFADEKANEIGKQPKLEELRELVRAGLLDAHNYLLLKDRLGPEDLKWGEENKSKISAYQKWKAKKEKVSS